MAAIADRYNENEYYSVNSCARDVMLGSIPRFLGIRNRMEGLFMRFDNSVIIKNKKWLPKYPNIITGAAPHPTNKQTNKQINKQTSLKEGTPSERRIIFQVTEGNKNALVLANCSQMLHL